ncbi:cysteine desulfurase [Subsaximicrobium wynnwilliamsii]|uniref:cysteine desulfurase n=1 Tax=Subsaximicrobium wynnwilliamsii TaxID=291179 RepID=A0A5C6ZF90_9FLAO|nr:cysteine desulfurase family protein [Subsaximicrobium wynnwilliamsii]TXD83165.1 cysteine desulfurase [Subsaximicrobium wynnwilliamsii]TXD88278.1 cysteine desulfurase [Subsaximicrobium wynnwilliamsii]TXE02999.1 cysteine desulfurase [Subsaximicrobium wynnwilliamsii]
MKTKNKIYLDYNATTPVDKRVVDAMLPYFTEMFGNASSDHVFGWDAEEAVEFAREQVSNLVNCKPTEITFTSGATEAANLALFGFCKRNSSKGKHIITCKTEHKAILDTMQALENEGFQIRYLDVDTEGTIDLEELENAINAETILVCLMLANNETGLIHPMKQIEKIVHSKGVKLMSDITQAVGKIPVDLKELNLDLAIFSSHKLYGPKGVGALYINKKNKVEIDQTVFGGGQEKGMRPGTLNVPGIVGFGKATEIASEEMQEESIRISKLRNRLEALLEEIEDVLINSKNSDRLPNTTNVSFGNSDGNQLIRKLNSLAVSRGSACTSNLINPSHVLKAMGLSDEVALSSLRISLGRNTTLADINFAAEEIKNTVHQLKKAVV